MKGNNKGFTLIELLVVIAIIGILSGIVLTSLNSARNKAKEARVQADLSSLRTGAEIYYSDEGTYLGMCTDEAVKPYIDSLNSQIDTDSVVVGCDTASATDYAIRATVNTVEYCADSKGYVGKCVPPEQDPV